MAKVRSTAVSNGGAGLFEVLHRLRCPIDQCPQPCCHALSGRIDEEKRLAGRGPIGKKPHETASPNFRNGNQRRKYSGSGPSQDRVTHGQWGTQPQFRGGENFDDPGLAVDQCPATRPWNGIPHQRQRQKIDRFLHGVDAWKVGLRDHDAMTFAHNSRDQSALFDWAEANCTIETLLQEIGCPIKEMTFERDIGIGRAEARGDATPIKIADQLGYGDAKMTASHPSGFRQRPADIVCLTQQSLRPRGQHFALGCDVHGARGSFDQPDAKIGLEICHAFGKRGLRNAQRFGSTGEGAREHDGAEGPQGCKVESFIHNHELCFRKCVLVHENGHCKEHSQDTATDFGMFTMTSDISARPSDTRNTPSEVVVQPAPGRLVTVGVLLLAATTIMANATIAPSLPSLRAHYDDVPGIETLAGLIITLPSLAVVLTAGLMGWLADRFDRQHLLLASGLLYALGGTSGLWVDGLPALLVGRMLLGVGVAGMMVLGTTWAGDLWVGPARARFLGQQGAMMSAGGIVVVIVGGALASLGWRGAFATYVLVLPITFLALFALAPYNRRQAKSKAAGLLVEGTIPWRAFAFVGSLAFFFMVIVYMMPTRLPFLLAERGVSNPLLVGIVMSTATFFSLPGALLYGRLRQRLSVMAVFALSWGLTGSGMLIVALAPTVPVMVGGVAVIGLGIGPSLPNYTSHWLAVVPPGLRGRAAGLMTTAFFAGQFASPLVSAPLVAAFGLSGSFEALAVMQLVLAGFLGFASLRAGRQLAAV
jgi:MFS family permease